MTQKTNPPGKNEDATWQLASVLDCILVSGDDAERFLQAQLTCDIRQLASKAVLPFAWCSPAGRVRYSGWLTAQTGGLCMLLPAGAAAACISELSRFVLRASVRLVSAADEGLSVSWKPQTGTLANTRFSEARDHVAACLLPGLPGRLVRVSAEAGPSGGDNDFILAGIRAGVCELPTVLADRFLPQMLNLDVTGGISFTKGCYPGQEVVARTHHLGRVKRRLMRFSSPPQDVPPGTNVLAEGAVAGVVVVSARSEHNSELLAVVNLESAARSDLTTDTPARAVLAPATLPYALPAVDDAR